MCKGDQRGAKLSIVPTPIGNLGDMTLRSIRTLEEADVIFAEDTRMTSKLISALGILTNARICRLDENTMEEHACEVADLVEGGSKVAYCSDAGMPGISDPGTRLVALLRERGLPVEVLPGPCAALVAYVSSAPQSQNFYFGGFLPKKESQRRAALEKVADLDTALVFYESPKRLAKSLQTIASVFPHRTISVCRELTKMHEEVATDSSIKIAEAFLEREKGSPIRGECVIVVDSPNETEEAERAFDARKYAEMEAMRLLEEGNMAKDVVKCIAEEHSIGRNEAYEIVLDKKREIDG